MGRLGCYRTQTPAAVTAAAGAAAPRRPSRKSAGISRLIVAAIKENILFEDCKEGHPRQLVGSSRLSSRSPEWEARG